MTLDQAYAPATEDPAGIREGAATLSAVPALPVAFRPSPGTYLRMRREAAGLSIPSLTIASGLPFFILDAAEADREPLTDLYVDALSRHLAFDREIYRNLRDGVPATPDICRDCACSWLDPCHREGTPCSWLDGTHSLCTACAAKAPAA